MSLPPLPGVASLAGATSALLQQRIEKAQMLPHEDRTQMDAVREFGLAQPKERRAAIANAADVRNGIKQQRPCALTDGAQLGVGITESGPYLGDGYCFLNIRSNPKAGQAPRYHLAWIETLVLGHPQHQIDLGSVAL